LDLSSLTDDGDTLELDDGRMLRLKIECDEDASINDYDADGKVEWTRSNSFGSVRPAEFSGRARKIDVDYPYSLWWEPWEGATDEQIRESIPRIVDLVRFGFKGVILELLQGEDAYHRPIVVESASLWGIDSLDNGYIHEVVSELADELEVSN
jgi:hypothetical protein